MRGHCVHAGSMEWRGRSRRVGLLPRMLLAMDVYGLGTGVHLDGWRHHQAGSQVAGTQHTRHEQPTRRLGLHLRPRPTHPRAHPFRLPSLPPAPPYCSWLRLATPSLL